MSQKWTHVVAAIVLNEKGEFLLSSRPKGKPYAGFWEFAGGKIEPEESELEALQRELYEELGIHIHAATPWLTKTYRYEHAQVYLRFYRVMPHQWTGEIQCKEQQQYSWQQAGRFDVSPMLPANGPILRALSLPLVMHGNENQGFIGKNGVGSVSIKRDKADVILCDGVEFLQDDSELLQLLPLNLRAIHELCPADGWWWHPNDEAEIKNILQNLTDNPVDMPVMALLSDDLKKHSDALQALGVHVAYVTDEKAHVL